MDHDDPRLVTSEAAQHAVPFAMMGGMLAFVLGGFIACLLVKLFDLLFPGVAARAAHFLSKLAGWAVLAAILAIISNAVLIATVHAVWQVPVSVIVVSGLLVWRTQGTELRRVLRWAVKIELAVTLVTAFPLSEAALSWLYLPFKLLALAPALFFFAVNAVMKPVFLPNNIAALWKDIGAFPLGYYSGQYSESIFGYWQPLWTVFLFYGLVVLVCLFVSINIRNLENRGFIRSPAMV